MLFNRYLLFSFILIGCISVLPAQNAQRYIVVDQFGYRPGDPKVAVLADPLIGFNSTDQFIPGSTYQVKRVSDNSVVYTGTPTQWNGGATHSQSGDRGWWFDFSSVQDTGMFYVYDTTNNVRSYYFQIAPDIYKNILKAACKFYYYQRINMVKDSTYVGAQWADGYEIPGDTVCRDINDPTNTTTIKDLSQGWMDAGDINKYITFAVVPVNQLLTAYTLNSTVFTDDFGIPESGNGIPDILDELKWELDWVKKMQDTTDGAAYIKVAHSDYSAPLPLSTDTFTRYYYTPKSTAATIDVASMMAHAALVYSNISGFTDYANDCKNRAILAWNYFMSTTMNDNLITVGIPGGDKDTTGQLEDAIVAAVYLYALTSDTVYQNYIKQHYTFSYPMKNMWWGWGLYNNYQNQALMYYTTLPNADATVKSAILAGKINSSSVSWTIWSNTNDLYRGYMPDGQYNWGGNETKADVGDTLMEFVTYNVIPSNNTSYINHALEVLHNFHGVNPMGLTYLTSMEQYGGSSCPHIIYHQRYGTNTCPPGYIPGGPNPNYAPDPSYVGPPIQPPMNQPAQKSYKDWGTGWPEDSWEVTEPDLAYQSDYVLLISYFANAQNSVTGLSDWTDYGNSDLYP